MLFECRFGRDGWVPVDELASELQVSRQPVMDAVKRLAIEGFVTIVPQVGCKVRGYAAAEIDEFFMLFAHCESVVAGLAAQRATAVDVVKLQVISDQFERLSGLKSSKHELARICRSVNRTLHSEVRRIARSTSVTEIVESLGDRSDFFIASSGRPMFADTLSMAHDEHLEIIAAIASHSADAAREAMKKHVLGTGARLQRLLTEDAQSNPKRTLRTPKDARRARA